MSGSSNLGNGRSGIIIEGTSNGNDIGGSSQKVNINAFNDKFGIEVVGENSAQILITDNSIHPNDELGINLSAQDGYYCITPNDSGDLDSGPNDLINFPVLSDASSITGFVSIHEDMVSFDYRPGTGFPPFYVGEVSILTNDPGSTSGDPSGCTPDLGPRSCLTAGGTYFPTSSYCRCTMP